MFHSTDAQQIHKFISEAAEINDRMNEKAKTLNVTDDGKDLEGVQSLIMRHEELEKDLTAIEDKLEVKSTNLKNIITVPCIQLSYKAPVHAH